MAKTIHGPKAMAEGCALVGWCSLAVGVVVLSILAARGVGTEGVGALLHTVGVYYIWLIFFYSYIPRAFQSPVSIPFALLILGAMGVRLFARLQRRVHAPQVFSRQP